MIAITTAAARYRASAGEHIKSPQPSTTVTEKSGSESRESHIARSRLTSPPQQTEVSADNAPQNLWGEIRLSDGNTLKIYKSGLVVMPNSVGGASGLEALEDMPADPKQRADKLLEALGGDLVLVDRDAEARSTFYAQAIGQGFRSPN